jgi:hypothetical protein
MFERKKIRDAESLANTVKAETYQIRSSLEETAALLQSVAAKIFLGDRQMANQVTAMITQEFMLISEDITNETNIIASLDHNTILRKKLLDHRTYLNARLVEINDLQIEMIGLLIKLNSTRVKANETTAKLNAELGAEVMRLAATGDFKAFVTAKSNQKLLQDGDFAAQVISMSKVQLNHSGPQKRAIAKFQKAIAKMRDTAESTRQSINACLHQVTGTK